MTRSRIPRGGHRTGPATPETSPKLTISARPGRATISASEPGAGSVALAEAGFNVTPVRRAYPDRNIIWRRDDVLGGENKAIGEHRPAGRRPGPPRDAD